MAFAWDFMNTDGIVDDDCDPYVAGSQPHHHCISECENGKHHMKLYKSTPF